MSHRLLVYCLAAVTAVWVVLFFNLPAGLFTIDELIQIAAIDALVRTGGFVTENDVLAPGHEALRLWLLRAGPDGLVPQYPSGFSFLAAPFWILGALKGVMVLNFAAAICVVALTALIARDVTGNRRVAMGAAALVMAGSFLADYAFAVWPHAIAVALSTFAFRAALRAVRGGDWRWSLSVGLALGVGGLFRVDVWFLVPALAMWAILVSARPVRDLILAGAGLAPWLLAASYLNWLKFGHFFPASYGASNGGGIDAGGYNYTFLALAIAALSCLVARLKGARWGWFMAAAGIAAIAVLSGGAEYLLATLRGFWVLGVDLREFKGVDVDRFIRSTPTGGVIFYFTLKKALAQSLPWLGVLPALWLLRRTAAPDERRFTDLLAVVTFTLMLFFASREWHGGLASNLRYLLPLAPVFAVGAIIAINRLPGKTVWGWRAGALAAIAIPVLFLASSNGFALRIMIEQRLPPVLFAVLAAVSVLAVTLPERMQTGFGRAARCGFGVSVALAIFTTFAGDVVTNFDRREIAVKRAGVVAATPARSLIYSGGFAGSWPVFTRPDVVLAAADRVTGEIAHDLTPVALGKGWRVFADAPDITASVLAAYPDLIAEIRSEDPYRAEIRRAN